MKRIAAVITALIISIPFMNCFKTEAFNFPISSTIYSESAVLINLDSETVVTEKNADKTQMPGALVNIMTAIVCLESTNKLSEEITVDSSVYADLINSQYPEDLIYADIYDGDVLTVNDLLYAMMLTSSVEASQTLAYHFGGESVSAFVDKMNAKAKELGCQNTNFTNPTGLYDTNQYTTARDLAIMTQYALKTSVFEDISSTWSYNPSVPNFQNHPEHSAWIWTHSNLMMDEDDVEYYYKGTRGIKTGNLSAVGRNLVTVASRDGNTYLAILLKAPLTDANGENKFYHIEDAKTLFNWAFTHFSYKDLISASEEIAEVSVSLAEGSDYVLLKPESEYNALWYDGVDTSLIKRDIEYQTDIQAPVSKGEKLGVVHLKYSGEEIASIDLVAVSDVKRSVSKYNIYAAKRFRDSEWFSKAFIISGILCFIYILLCIYSFICYKNNTKPVRPIYAVPKINNKKHKKKKRD